MIKRFFRGSLPVNDTDLRGVLRQYDPMPAPSESSLAALETQILARVADQRANAVLMDVGIFSGFLQQGWMTRAVAFAAVLVIASGFFFGQTFYNAESEASLTDGFSLVAFADDTSAGQILPVTNTTWGENDDDAN